MSNIASTRTLGASNARPLRLEFAGALYHVTARGNRRAMIYEDDSDRFAFLETLSRVCVDKNWLCHAYCLMGNHYHLLLETPEAKLDSSETLSEIPTTQRRPVARPLEDIVRSSPDRNAAIRAAHASGGYSMREIGDCFGLHYSRVSRIVRGARGKT